MTYYKALAKEHAGPYSGFDFAPYLPKNGKPGKWLPKVEHLEMCESGYHVATQDTIIEWLNAEIYEVEIRGETLEGDNKIAVQEMRFVRRCAGWSERTARLFACDCAERVLHLWERDYPNDTRVRDCISVARRHAARDAALAAAGDAAWAAAGDAAWAAARSAARSAAAAAAGDAAWDAARSAARDAAAAAAGDAAWAAARSAARDAAWDAAWDAARSAARSAALAAAAAAAGDAAWDAARSAARDAALAAARSAARSAAWDAERKWQTSQLVAMLEKAAANGR